MMSPEQHRHCASSKLQVAFCLEKCSGGLNLKWAVLKLCHREILTAISATMMTERKKKEHELNILIRWFHLIFITILYTIYQVNICTPIWQITKLSPKEVNQPTKGHIAHKQQSRNSKPDLSDSKVSVLSTDHNNLLWMARAFTTQGRQYAEYTILRFQKQNFQIL